MRKLGEQYHLPVATVVSAVLASDVATVVIDLDDCGQAYASYPVAPADLRETDPHRHVFPLHQLVARDARELTFETYAVAEPLPLVGHAYTFCSWFLPDALDALRDPDASWELLDYPDNGDHDHCLFTGVTIAAYADKTRGYRSDHGWVTVAAYEEYIQRDSLRVRNHWRSIESPA